MWIRQCSTDSCGEKIAHRETAPGEAKDREQIRAALTLLEGVDAEEWPGNEPTQQRRRSSIGCARDELRRLLES